MNSNVNLHMFPAPIGKSIFTEKNEFFMTFLNESPSKFQYIYPVVFNVRKKIIILKQILSKSGFPMNPWIELPQTVSSRILNSEKTRLAGLQVRLFF